MDKKKLVELAYDMELKYKTYRTKDEAIEQMKEDNAYIDSEIIEAMWYAIDAYVDINIT